MKYLQALLREAENLPYPKEGNHQNRQKPLLSVLSGAPGKDTKEIKKLQEPSPWPCRHCGNPIEVEAVEPSLDGKRMVTWWRCVCGGWGVTPEGWPYPLVWVTGPLQ